MILSKNDFTALVNYEGDYRHIHYFKTMDGAKACTKILDKYGFTVTWTDDNFEVKVSLSSYINSDSAIFNLVKSKAIKAGEFADTNSLELETI